MVEEELAVIAAAIVDGLPEEEAGSEEEESLAPKLHVPASAAESEKEPMKAGSLSFDELVAEAIQAVEDEFEAEYESAEAGLESEEAGEGAEADPIVSEEYYALEDLLEEPEELGFEEEDVAKSQEEKEEVPVGASTEAIPTLSADIAAIQDSLLEQDVKLAQVSLSLSLSLPLQLRACNALALKEEEEILAEELKSIEEELKDLALAVSRERNGREGWR